MQPGRHNPRVYDESGMIARLEDGLFGYMSASLPKAVLTI